MKKHGFTLIEILVVLLIVGIIVAVMIPTVRKILPNKDKARVKKAYNTLSNVIGELTDDNDIYLNGMFNKDGNGNNVGATYFCQQFADRVNTSGVITCDGTAKVTTQRLGYNSDTFFTSLDSKCDKRTDKSRFAFKTSDGIYWYGMYSAFGDGETLYNEDHINITYVIVCADVNPDDATALPYAFGVRRDGKIMIGKRAQDILDEDSIR